MTKELPSLFAFFRRLVHRRWEVFTPSGQHLQLCWTETGARTLATRMNEIRRDGLRRADRRARADFRMSNREYDHYKQYLREKRQQTYTVKEVWL